MTIIAEVEMGYLAWLYSRLKAVRGALDGTLEDRLAEAEAWRKAYRWNWQDEKARSAELERLLEAEQEAHRNTHARLVRAAKRVVRLRDERRADEARRTRDLARQQAYEDSVWRRLSLIPDDVS